MTPSLSAVASSRRLGPFLSAARARWKTDVWSDAVRLSGGSNSGFLADSLRAPDRKDGASDNTQSYVHPLVPSPLRAIAGRWVVHLRSANASFTTTPVRCLIGQSSNH